MTEEAEYQICDDCQKRKPDVHERICCYYQELYEEDHIEIVCDDCEYDHGMDI